MDKLKPVDLSLLSPSSFFDEELDLPYYLVHFHRLANSLVEEGEDHGFIGLPVWRREKDNKPYNARIMENILSFAFFYCTDRPWNPYHGDPVLKERLEATLAFWCNIQNEDGRFSEYGPSKWNLAATAFATKFMGQTLQLLNGGPTVDGELLERVRRADANALRAVFKDEDFQTHGRSFTNQYANAWSGALAYLDLYPDTALEHYFTERVEESMTEFQSPAGYFYEKDGPDWGYYLGTHSSDLHGAWHYAKGTDLGDLFLEKSRRFYDWFAHNAVMEPDGAGFAMNRSIETRQQRRFLVANRFHQHPRARTRDEVLENCPLAEHVEVARAFARTDEELESDYARARSEVENTWPKIEDLQVGEFWSFSPYAFLHRGHTHWAPSSREREEARARLPYVAHDRFIHQRIDERNPVIFTFLRWPRFYTTFSSGTITSQQQRYGLGLLWHPSAGTVIQSQTGTSDAAWGTRLAGEEGVVEGASFEATYAAGGSRVQLEPGIRDIPVGEFVVSYPLPGGGRKTVSFDEASVRVVVDCEGEAVEQIPILVGESDAVSETDGGIRLTRELVNLAITCKDAVATVADTDYVSGDRAVKTVLLKAKGPFSYRIGFK